LAVPHIDGVHAGCPVLQEAVRETAGRCPNVRHHPALWLKTKDVQGLLQFEPAAADVRQPRGHLYAGVLCYRCGGPPLHLAVHAHLAGQDEALGLLATLGQTPLVQELVQASAGHEAPSGTRRPPPV